MKVAVTYKVEVIGLNGPRPGDIGLDWTMTKGMYLVLSVDHEKRVVWALLLSGDSKRRAGEVVSRFWFNNGEVLRWTGKATA